MADKQATGMAPASPNVELVRQMYTAIEQDDHEAYRRLVDPNISWEVLKNYPEGGTRTGYNAVFEGDGFFSSLYKQFDEWHATPEEYLDADDNVIAVGVYQGQVNANQVRVESPFVHIWTLRDGKLARMRQFTDTVAFAQALAGGALTANTLQVL